MIVQMTRKEHAMHDCARMILRDECPPDRAYYLCMEGEEDNDLDCIRCWERYLWDLAGGAVELPGRSMNSFLRKCRAQGQQDAKAAPSPRD